MDINVVDFVIVNIPFVLALILLIVRCVISVKNGFAKELCSFVSTVVATIVIFLLGFAIRQYFKEARLLFVITIVLLFLLLVLYKILNMFLTSIKLVSKLPVIHLADKILGIIMGVINTVVVVWAVYCVVIVYDEGAFSNWIMNCVNNNAIMRSLYENNGMYSLLTLINGSLKNIDIFAKLGM